MMAPASEDSDLQTTLSGNPALTELTRRVLDAWPGHRDYLAKSFCQRNTEMLESSETIAEVILKLAEDDLVGFAQDYRWLCGQVREEELNFARTGRYRYSTFAETSEHVYSDDAFMARYMHGLLFSQSLWFMHASSLHFFIQRLPQHVGPRGRVMEIGPGHGLLLFLALRELEMREAVAWDISPVSLDHTRAALEKLGVAAKAQFDCRDLGDNSEADGTYDLIILSHLLEHLEDPVQALQRLRPLVADGGIIFVNVPLNAPMPDHLQLLGTPDEAKDMIRDGGFRITEFETHTTQGVALDRAIRRKLATTCSIIAEPA